MDLQLRFVASHPYGGQRSTPTDFTLSSRTPRLVIGCGDLLIDQNTATNAIQASIRTSARIDKVVYVGGGSSVLIFMENGYVASYAEQLSSLKLIQEKKISGAERSVTLGQGSQFGHFALFCKADSPSLWCLRVNEDGTLHEPFKLRSDIEGEQESVNFVGGVVAKVRGKVATNAKARLCPIVSVAMHPNLPLAAAAYSNGIIRVWDVARKEQRSHFDAQLLLAEKIVDIALHPNLPVVVVCTTQGRIMSFYVKRVLYKRGEEPVLASSKTRDRKRRFQAMCFMSGHPASLMLLTTSRRILVRMIDKASLIVDSTRYEKPSKQLPLTESIDDGKSSLAAVDDATEAMPANQDRTKFLCEPVFGLIFASFSSGGKVYVFQKRTNALPDIRRSVSSGLDTGFPEPPHDPITGPVAVPPDSLVVHSNVLFRYELGSDQVTRLCQLPSGDYYRVEVARDEFGYCCAALLFFHANDESNPAFGSAEGGPSTRYVLCTRRGETEAWNVSEPSEGLAGCFLNISGKEDKIVVLANTGTLISILSFINSSGMQGSTAPAGRTRGVQRVKLDGRKVRGVYRTPFASCTAIMYHDSEANLVCLSRNARDPDALTGSPEAMQSISDRDIAMDGELSLSLHAEESILDVRWQRFPALGDRRSKRNRNFGAIMTEKRIYFVREFLQPVSVFEFQTISRFVVPLSLPSLAWVGPFVMLLFGSSLICVCLDGRADLIAGVSHGQHVSTMVAGLPDRIVYARPSEKHAMNTLSVSSRPYSALSGVLRGVLVLNDERTSSGSQLMERVRRILELHDVSQGSVEVSRSLIVNKMSPIAYLLTVSEQGKTSIPPLRRAMLLGRMGDIRGALSIAQDEYSHLSQANAFHEGSELYRIIQRILNMAFASGDLHVGRRCSALLGRRGTLSAFVDVEGGYAAVKAISNYARSAGNNEVVDKLMPLVQRAAKSSVATDESVIPSQRELESVRRALQAADLSSIPLGKRDGSKILMPIPPAEYTDGVQSPTVWTDIPPIVQAEVNDRIEVFRRDVGCEGFDQLDEHSDLQENMMSSAVPETVETSDLPTNRGTGDQPSDSSDDEALFQTGGHMSTNSFTGTAGTAAAPERPATDFVQQQAQITRSKIQQLKEGTAGPVQEGREATEELLRAQTRAGVDGKTMTTVRAEDLIERGIRKLDEGRFTSAQKHFESALRAIARGRQKGEHTTVDLIHQLVQYNLFARVRTTMEEIRSSAHSRTTAGKLTYAELATALTALPLRKQHRVEVLVMAADANMITNNFGTAAQAMHAIKDIGVPNELRASLRDKYAACSARGFANARQLSIPRLCYRTLRSFQPGFTGLSCDVCPGKFLPDSGVSSSDVCPSCGCGTLQGT